MSAQFDMAQARFNMVEQQVRTWDVLEHRVLDVLHAIPRERFVSAGQANLAYADLALPLAHGEYLFKPVLDGRILQSLNPTADEDVLEIGTGSGYLTACLAQLSRRVTTVDLHADLLTEARAAATAANVHNIEYVHADAFAAFIPKQRFDCIVLGGAVATIPAIVWQWLKPHGRIFAVRGVSPAMEAVLLRGSAQAATHTSLFETDVPYLHGCAPIKKFVF